MMNTPVCDFVRAYAEKKALRLHMPGHKGLGPLGIEALDITEIEGADSLFEADGILRESEENASALFGCPTFYSTEGSSLCIRAMLYLSRLHALSSGRRPLVLAGRNAHKTFLSALALLDIDVEWLYPAQESSYLACPLDAQALEQAFAGASAPPGAVYITSPDYLGHVADIAALAEVCHRHGALLLVDNAHGAYLRFLPESMHPMELGADLCCDSAHKTLPVLTGGAYLHIARHLPALAASAKDALALFGSTSPSYLLLQSLDAANPYLEGYPARLRDFCGHAARFKDALRAHGYQLIEEEPLKATILARAFGYSGR
ncbi:MAG: PLP-dependent transferase, partial [Eubacteriales bacterium]|nr:PLP-dependent transferase [Eubacteriales bacterium]